MIQDYIDMDTQEKVRYVSESSNASTSGYSTISTQPGNQSPISNFSNNSKSMSPSPKTTIKYAMAATALPTEFSQLNLPPSMNAMNPPKNNTNNNYTQFPSISGYNTKNQNQPDAYTLTDGTGDGADGYANYADALLTLQSPTKKNYAAELRILEHPVEKFRFRYKSEMHGTHGSLNGTNSKRSPKTFPEVELCNYYGHAVIRCSLFQANLNSPHSHQLVVRKDEQDICDPHDMIVAPDRGYIVQFQNMGIIHTAKKFIYDELLSKKLNRLRFMLGREELSTKELQELRNQTEREAKDMNLNQVRLCFEAFHVSDDKHWTPIAAPVYTNPINNRKSAQTGELRICRLSIASGSVLGGDDLILLVEKVSKKNIKVRFFELNEDEETTWEAFGKFREADVHHQYAIVCQTPAYKDKNIETPVEIFIELIRPSDDERSYPPVTFRYKPCDTVISRKRRRTTSSVNTHNNNNSLSSSELPQTLHDVTATTTAAHLMPAPINHNNVFNNNMQQQQQKDYQGINIYGNNKPPTISEEFNKDHELQKLICSDVFDALITNNSEELTKYCPQNISDLCFELDPTNNYDQSQQQQQQQPSNSSYHGRLETDGAANDEDENKQQQQQKLINILFNRQYANKTTNMHLNKIFSTFDAIRWMKLKPKEHAENVKKASRVIGELYVEYAERNALGESLLHELVATDELTMFIKLLHILKYLQLSDLLNTQVSVRDESVLHAVVSHNRQHFVRPLLLAGCNANLQNDAGNTAVHVAVMENYVQCLEHLLMKDKVHLNLRNDEGLTALHIAIRLNNVGAMRQLLTYDEHAAEICNAKDGNNALHMAALQQNTQMVEMLLGQRRLLYVCNASGKLAIDLCKQLALKMGGKFLVNFNDLLREISDNEEPKKLDNSGLGTMNMKSLLQDGKKLEKIIGLLNEEEKWKILAQKCNLKHLICLWNNAEDMLSYMSTTIPANFDYQVFTGALAQVDADAMEVLKIV